MVYFPEKIENILKFILLQDPVKIAIGVALGLVFSQVCLGIIKDCVEPIVQLSLRFFFKTGAVSFKGINFKYGQIIEKLCTFIIFILILYFIIVIPIGKLKRKYNISKKRAKCPYCIQVIDTESSRCQYCTSQLNPEWFENKDTFTY
jgi:large conductance mechanosensitive channel